MRIIDPGHRYALDHLDGDLEQLLTFVKREGPRYPGNIGSHPGTNLQEVFRACIDRLKYLDRQEACAANAQIITNLRNSIRFLEERAAKRHGRAPDKLLYGRLGATSDQIDHLPTCLHCGHIGCQERTA